MPMMSWNVLRSRERVTTAMCVLAEVLLYVHRNRRFVRDGLCSFFLLGLMNVRRDHRRSGRDVTRLSVWLLGLL